MLISDRTECGEGSEENTRLICGVDSVDDASSLPPLFPNPAVCPQCSLPNEHCAPVLIRNKGGRQLRKPAFTQSLWMCLTCNQVHCLPPEQNQVLRGRALCQLPATFAQLSVLRRE
jgi:hypothetical protein